MSVAPLLSLSLVTAIRDDLPTSHQAALGVHADDRRKLANWAGDAWMTSRVRPRAGLSGVPSDAGLPFAPWLVVRVGKAANWVGQPPACLFSCGSLKREASSRRGDGEARRGWRSAGFLALVSSFRPRDHDHQSYCQHCFDLVRVRTDPQDTMATRSSG